MLRENDDESEIKFKLVEQGYAGILVNPEYSYIFICSRY